MKCCDAKTMTAPKVEQALLKYFDSIADLDVMDKVELEANQHQLRQDIQIQINALTDKLYRLDSKEKEVMNLYILKTLILTVTDQLKSS